MISKNTYVLFPTFSFIHTNNYWTGARRTCNSTAGDKSAFMWLDKSPMEFQWWYFGEPNLVSQMCVMTYYVQNYTWFDVECSTGNWLVHPVCQFRPLARKELY